MITLSDLRKTHYLGDGLYAGIDNFGSLWLVTHDGIKTTNEICLEQPVLENFKLYIHQMGKDTL